MKTQAQPPFAGSPSPPQPGQSTGQPGQPGAAPGGGASPFGGAPAAGPPTPPEPSIKVGDLVIDPVGLGRDIILQVVSTAEPLAFVVGDVFNEPTPWPMDRLQSMKDPSEGEGETSDEAHKMLQSMRQLVSIAASDFSIRTAQDYGVTRLEMLQEGLGRLAPAVLAAGGMALVLTYNALGKIVDKLVEDARNAREPEQDYGFQGQQFFLY